eukprot:TRINITY_DN29058_c0_g1_i1.p1 TRINITY_DN29058_c0_g1~~TRINITY_DN29058_c0_g1_i1.p1  ORF type:complete len:431 (-),score=72.94 TRINITY_DN29058_c0_g1_i1:83-1264(-)
MEDARRMHPRYHERRPGEVISSLGTQPALPAGVAATADPDGGSDEFHSRRSCTPIRTTAFRDKASGMRSSHILPGSPLPGPGRSPRSSLRIPRPSRNSFHSDFHEVLGSSFPCSGAASAQEDSVAGRGLRLSMQRGIGALAGAGAAESAGSFSDAAATLPPRRPSKDSGGALVPAGRYEAVDVEDPIDRCFERTAKEVDPATLVPGAVLLVRRLSRGEYEVQGAKVSVGWLRLASGSREAYVFDAAGNAVETLAAFLQRSAEVAAMRASAPGPSFASFGHPGAGASGLPVAPPALGPFAGSFYGPRGQEAAPPHVGSSPSGIFGVFGPADLSHGKGGTHPPQANGPVPAPVPVPGPWSWHQNQGSFYGAGQPLSVAPQGLGMPPRVPTFVSVG